jgi:SAM-dependent methyltransferase
LGVDISRVMLDRAEERARVGQFKHVSFIQADAQTHPFETDAFDVAVSRFGVMFFQDPPAAFANVRRALKPGGRLAFVCWRDARENPWMIEPMMAVADLVELPPPPEPHEPGPFAFAEEDYTRGILEKAGYSGIALERFDEPILMAAGANIDATIDFYFQIGPLSRLLAEATDETKAAVVERLREVLAPRATADGISFGASAWIVSARA